MSDAARSMLDREVTLIFGNQASVNILVCLVTAVLSMVLYIVAFSTVGWGAVISDTHFVRYGVWKYCFHFPKAPTVDECWNLGSGAPAYHKAFQGFAVITLLVSIVVVAGVATYIFVPKFNKDRRVALGIVSACAVFAFLTFLTSLIFIGGFVNDPNLKKDIGYQSIKPAYSFGIAYGSILLTAIACVLGTYELFASPGMIPA